MKKMALVAILIAVAGIVAAQDWRETPYGDIRLERSTFEGNSSYHFVKLIVQYRNTTDRTFTAVRITGTVFDGDERVIGTNSRSWFEHVDGPIYPGFIGVQEIPIEYTNLPRPTLQSISVYAQEIQ